MCNAWNHPPECTCGWGGEGHLGRSPGNIGAFGNSGGNSSLWTLYESYITPNARCPICGCRVWFYQSPEGGRVFFDEVGPPWPKHPCTDNRTHKQQPAKNSYSSGPEFKYKWQAEGWEPYICMKAETVGYRVRITGYFIREGEVLVLYIDGADWRGRDSLMFVRKSKGGSKQYEIATFELDHISKEVRVFYIQASSTMFGLR